ncbi:MAG: hypothetical protein AB7N69_06685 [Immundisolibacter sp.]|uniref:hypothetical protein n=1 Tax=Immundisolibacter sp. TaxID=1934948 RepID=UPI003D0E9746
MNLFLTAIAVILVVFFIRKLIPILSKGNSHLQPQRKQYADDYEIWLDVFKKEKIHVEEFDLYGTKAAITWNAGDSEVTVICITEFTNKMPSTKKWDHFDFNIKDKSWIGTTPRGSATRIREELSRLGLI